MRIWLLVLLFGTAALAEPVTFRTEPSGVAVYDPFGQYLGVSGQPLQLNLESYPNGGPFNFERKNYQKLAVFIPAAQLRGTYPPEGLEPVRLHPLYAWVPALEFVQGHPVVLGFVLFACGAAAWVGLSRWRVHARHHRALMALHARANPDDSLVMARLGSYRLVEQLGAGGMARVYRALPEDHLHDPSRSVAVKVLHRDYWNDEEQGGRFKREIEAYLKLRHPSIVMLVDYGTQDGLAYLVLEYIKGSTLRSHTPENGFPPDQAIGYLNILVRALAHAHAQGIVHRDLKPENVMITENGELKLMDFGLARAWDSGTLTKTGTVMGTPAYMSPEQITGTVAAGPASDQYSLGVMAFELLSGRRPFESEDPVQLIFRHLNDVPPRMGGSVPTALEEIVARMLKKNPADRFPDLEAVGEALKGARVGV